MGSSLPKGFFKAKSVAIVGASKTNRLGHNALVNLTSSGFKGSIYPVNPRYSEIDGIACFPDLSSIPEVPDMVYILISRDYVLDVVKEAARLKIKKLVISTGGFKETDKEGAELEEKLKEIMNQNGIRAIGPNSEGFWNLEDDMIISFGSAARGDAPKVKAPLAFVSQSGSIGGAIARRFQESGIGLSYMVSVGNETNVDIIDVAEWLVENSKVKVIGMFVEGFNSGNRLVNLSKKAQDRHISLVALHGGTTAAGKEVALSHTGKMITDSVAYEGAFEQLGIIQAYTLRELELLMGVLAFNDSNQEKGPAIIGMSGGGRLTFIDNLAKYDINIPQFSSDTRAKLSAILPSFAGINNPIDPVASELTIKDLIPTLNDIVLSEKNVGSSVNVFGNRGVEYIREYREKLVELARNGKPIILTLISGKIEDSEKSALLRNKVIVTDDPADSAIVLRALRKPKTLEECPYIQSRASESHRLQFDRVLNLFLHNRLNFQTPIDLSSTDVSFPVVAKLAPSENVHKTDIGGVVTNIRDVRELKDAVERLKGLNQSRVIVQKMITGVEAIANIRNDVNFGPMLTLGVGGTLTEVFKSVSVRIVPVNRSEVHAMLRESYIGKLLDNKRGNAKPNKEKFVDYIMKFQYLYINNEKIKEIEINPLIIPYDGGEPVAVDVVVEEI
ncbi:MAG: acetate--CoA ligase family protein [Candidatus Thermoplasmatota archaeon]|nr:acetate--CoA ligase family protein [Candidatus Thermoplasmatota archaeon]